MENQKLHGNGTKKARPHEQNGKHEMERKQRTNLQSQNQLEQNYNKHRRCQHGQHESPYKNCNTYLAQSKTLK